MKKIKVLMLVMFFVVTLISTTGLFAGEKGKEIEGGKIGIEKVENGKTINILLLYLDLSVCDPCQGTESTLEKSIDEAAKILKESGYGINLEKIHIKTKELAKKHKFLTSPTIRINGKDIQLDFKEALCATCGTLTKESNVNCRKWLYKGKSYSYPPKDMIVGAIMDYVKGKKKAEMSDKRYIMPDNIKNFFKSRIGCGIKEKSNKKSSNNNSCTTSGCDTKKKQ